MNNKPLIIYHRNCPDGITAAWVVWRHFNGNADLQSANYGEQAAEQAPDPTDREVYIVDFSYSRMELAAMAMYAKKLVVLDHHKTAQANLVGLEEELNKLGRDVTIMFDMERSGARLAWDYCNPCKDFDPPIIVEYCEDRDLWRWNLPASREINAAIGSYKFDVQTWDRLSKQTWEDLRVEGEAILRYQNREIEEMLGISFIGEVAGYKVPILNCNVKSLTPEACNRLARDYPFSVAWYMNEKGEYSYSFRSVMGEKNPIGVDVSEITKQFGGGGHSCAAGCISKLPLFKKV